MCGIGQCSATCCMCFLFIWVAFLGLKLLIVHADMCLEIHVGREMLELVVQLFCDSVPGVYNDDKPS
jgi:hypothetical protein